MEKEAISVAGAESSDESNQKVRPSLSLGQLKAWCYFVRDRRWGTQQKKLLFNHFGSLTNLVNASDKELRDANVGKRLRRTSDVDKKMLEADLAWLQKPGHHLITLNCADYPLALKQLPDPPIAMFAIGDTSLLSEPKIAIVGSRQPTPIGVKATKVFAADLAKLGVVVTSGMALGVDGVAHAAALDQQAPSIAVLGCGLYICYPARNRVLYERLQNEGLALSEYPLGVPPDRHTFPQRNRIVSGLSLGVLIVEAAERSGTLITARLACEQNRAVMVLPGSVFSKQYQGSHKLIQQGASLVTSVADVVAHLAGELSAFTSLGVNRLDQVGAENLRSGSAPVLQAMALLKHISTESSSMDDIILSSGLTAAEVSSILLELELGGHVAVASDGGYVNLT